MKLYKYSKKLKSISTGLLFLSLIMLVVSCGDPVVEVDNSQYEPKIAVEAYLYAGETVSGIKLTRNFQVGEQVNLDSLRLTPENNAVVISINDIPLFYDSQLKEYYNNNILIDYNKTYTLKVSANVNGVALQATSNTTTPAEGFRLINKDLGDFIYRQGEIALNFYSSPGTEFYAFSFLADSASVDNFIFNNPFNPNIKIEDLEKNFNRFVYQAGYVTNINSYLTDPFKYTVQVYDAWFYSSYKTIVYAGDANFRAYIFTAKNVQEFDGNFHEPQILFTGDGIGVFASAIRDTATFTILKN